MNVADLSGLFFLDTNIFVYTFDSTAPEKRQIAEQLVRDSLRTKRGVISSQIVQEFLNVALRKFERPMTISDSRDYLRTVLLPLCQHYPSVTFYERALLIKAETGYSFYDTLVVTAALESGCTTLFSEDMQDGRIIRELTIVNPFTG
ncbi:MAG: PIN domain-containing protein [Aquificales bacterium]|nr:PIN domain-containing protein [Aquificales bacterium]